MPLKIDGPDTLHAGEIGEFSMNPPLAHPCRIVEWILNGSTVPNNVSIGARFGNFIFRGWTADGRIRVESTVEGGSPQITVRVDCPGTGISVATRPHGDWNDGTYWVPGNGVQGNNNCYDYACGIKWAGAANGHKSMPGRAHNFFLTLPLECDELIVGAALDGLSYIGEDKTVQCPAGCTRVALVHSGTDFHWYREDAPGRWSHKPGHRSATDCDASGDPITDPEEADRRAIENGEVIQDYDTFCGYFCVCPGNVTIAMLSPGASQTLALSAEMSASFVLSAGSIVARLPPGRIDVKFRPQKDMSERAKVTEPRYSGMEDPAWWLSARDTARLVALVRSLKPLEGVPEGFAPRYSVHLPARKGLPEFLSVAEGVVGAWYAPAGVRYFRAPASLMRLVAPQVPGQPPSRPNKPRKVRR